jgi:hypothetical protein
VSRIVLEVRRNGQTKDLWVSLAEPGGHPEAGDFYPFTYDSADPEPVSFASGMGNVREIGEYIAGRLAHHPSVRIALDSAQLAALGAPTPVLVRLAPQAEAIPWETLFGREGFLALDQRWPIGRMSTAGPGPAAPARFGGVLRVMAVLAAAGLDATRQWEELRDGLAALPFEVHVHLLVAQDELKAAALAASQGRLTVTADYVPPGRELPSRITAFRPNIMHFFCHGGVEDGAAFLDIATRSTAGGGRGGVQVELSDFPVATLTSDLWLIVLNACRGALPPSGTASLVSALAARGVPAVAGMREAVTEGDAHAFCRGFYRALVPLLKPLADSPGPVTVDWCEALHEARLEICGLHSGTSPWSVAARRIREWTLPVMYIQSAPFTISRPQLPLQLASPPRWLPPDERAAREAELQVLRNLAASDLGTPDEVRRLYQDRIATLEMVLAV